MLVTAVRRTVSIWSLLYLDDIELLLPVFDVCLCLLEAFGDVDGPQGLGLVGPHEHPPADRGEVGGLPLLPDDVEDVGVAIRRGVVDAVAGVLLGVVDPLHTRTSMSTNAYRGSMRVIRVNRSWTLC